MSACDEEREARKKAVLDAGCAVCGKHEEIRLCGRCGGAAYCGRDHQLEYWPGHKADCKRLAPRKNKKSAEDDTMTMARGWAQGLHPDKQMEWLCDCYRLAHFLCDQRLTYLMPNL
jgi:hypothetical protein